MKKIFALLLVVSMLLCACATSVQNSNRNVGKPIEEESAPTGSSGTVPTVSTGAPVPESTGPAHVHTWGDWKIIKFANPEETGEKNHTCTVCGTTQSEVIPKVSYEGVNYFYNPENNIIADGEISVRPRCVYWSNGKLYAEVFLINGKDTTFTVNSITYLRISNSGTNLAYAENFSNSGATLSPGYHTVLYLEFSGDQVLNYGFGLDPLRFEFGWN